MGVDAVVKPASKDDRTDDVTDSLVQKLKRTERLALLFELGEFPHEFVDLMLYAFFQRLTLHGTRHTAAT